MTVNYTSLLSFGQPVTGTESGTWGDDVNNAVTAYLDISIAGTLSLSGDGAVTLANTQGTNSATNIGATTAQYHALKIVGPLSATKVITAPNSSRSYVVFNTDSTHGVTIKASGQTGVTVPANSRGYVAFDGTDYVFVAGTSPQSLTGLGTGVATALGVNVGSAGSFVVNGGALGTPSSGTLTNATGLPISTGVSGLGSGVATFLATPTSANLAAAVTGETGTGALVFATSPTLVTPALGTPTSGTLTSCTGLPLTTGVTGTLPLANGGTGQTTAQAAINSLAGATTNAQYLRGNGSNVVMSAIQASDVPTLNQNTTGTAANVTGVVAIANGGTGATDAATARSNLGAGTVNSVGGTGSVNGITLTGTVTSTGNLTLGGTLSNVNLGSQVTGTLPLANGGTGQTTAQAAINSLAGATTNAQYLRGNGSNVVMSAIQASDVPTLNQNTTGTAANVTGVVAIANGGTNASTAGAARTNLGSTTVGDSFFTLTNPSAIRFPRINANNTVTALSDSDFRTAIGAGTGNGSVTSVGGTGNVNGITLTGTVTSTGNLTLGGSLSGVSLTSQVTGTLPVANGGTGATTFTSGRLIAGNVTSAFTSSIVEVTSNSVKIGELGFLPSPAPPPLVATLTVSNRINIQRSLDTGDAVLSFFPGNSSSIQFKANGTTFSINETLGTSTGTVATIDSYATTHTWNQSPLFSPFAELMRLTSSALKVSAPQVTAPDGTASAPTYSFSSSGNDDNGMYLPASNAVGFSTAGSERLRIDSSGYVGIGTTNTGFNSAGLPLVVGSGSGNTGLTIFSGNASSGSIHFADTVTTGGGSFEGYIAYNHSTNLMTFGTSATSKMVIDSSGDVMIGTTTNPGKFNVLAGADELFTVRTTGGGVLLDAVNAGNNAYKLFSIGGSSIAFQINAADKVKIDANGYLLVDYASSNGAYKLQVNSQIFATNATIATSDGRYKKNVVTIPSALGIVSLLRPVSFTWKAHPIHNFPVGITDVGFIAQEVKQALETTGYGDQVIKANTVTLPDGVKEDFLGIADNKLIPLLVKAIQELAAKVATLESKLN